MNLVKTTTINNFKSLKIVYNRLILYKAYSKRKRYDIRGFYHKSIYVLASKLFSSILNLSCGNINNHHIIYSHPV